MPAFLNIGALCNAIESRVGYYIYNANGELIAMMDWNGTVNFALDVLGRITSVNDHNELITSYTYDAPGRLSNLKDAENQNTVYAYDAAS